MPSRIEVLFTPAEFAALPSRDLSETTCVVFDIFRATTTIVTALASGATAVVPVADIAEALAVHKAHPDHLLAGERDGLRIHGALTGGIEFHLGNSPREFKPETVRGKTVVITTTNGSRALRACAKAGRVFACSFLNLEATVDAVQKHQLQKVLLVCSGTGDHAAYEDILGAGAVVDKFGGSLATSEIGDSASAALAVYQKHSANLAAAAQESSNGRRLLSIPELRDDVAFCLRRDVFPLVAEMRNGRIEAHHSAFHRGLELSVDKTGH